MEDEDQNDQIKPPAPHKVRDAARAAVEGTVEIVPGGGIATGVLRVLAPSRSDKEQGAWQQAISDRSNEHDAKLDQHQALLEPTETITGLPARMLVLLARDCPDGLGDKDYELDDLCAWLPGEDRQAVKDAVFDLKAVGLLKSTDWMGGWAVSLSEDAYAEIDAQVMGWSTAEDALAIARLMLSEDTGDAPTLHEKTGWSKRRFNPAFRLLLPLFPDGRIRKVIQPDYPALGVVLADEDRATLRRFIAKAEKEQ